MAGHDSLYDYLMSRAMNDGQQFGENSSFMDTNDYGYMDSGQGNIEPHGYCETYDGYYPNGGYDNGYTNFTPMDLPYDDGPMMDYCYEGDNSTWDFSQQHFQVEQQEESQNLEEIFSNYIRTHFDDKEAFRLERQDLKEMLACQQESIHSLEKTMSYLSQLVEEQANAYSPEVKFVEPTIFKPPTTPVEDTSRETNWCFYDYDDEVDIIEVPNTFKNYDNPLGNVEEDDKEEEKVVETLPSPNVFTIYNNPLGDGKDDSEDEDDAEDDEVVQTLPTPNVFTIYNNPLGVGEDDSEDEEDLDDENVKPESFKLYNNPLGYDIDDCGEVLQPEVDYPPFSERESFVDSRVDYIFSMQMEKIDLDFIYTTRGVNDWLTILIRGTFSTDFTCRPIGVGEDYPVRN